MLTRIEIHGFKTIETFETFGLDVRPFSAIVGPNASGKSNLFDALKFLSLLAVHDVRTAMLSLRGEPEELFRRTEAGWFDEMRFAIEVLLDRTGTDSFGTRYTLKARRLRYELHLSLKKDARGQPRGIFVTHELCDAITNKDDELRRDRSSGATPATECPGCCRPSPGLRDWTHCAGLGYSGPSRPDCAPL